MSLVVWRRKAARVNHIAPPRSHSAMVCIHLWVINNIVVVRGRKKTDRPPPQIKSRKLTKIVGACKASSGMTGRANRPPPSQPPAGGNPWSKNSRVPWDSKAGRGGATYLRGGVCIIGVGEAEGARAILGQGGGRGAAGSPGRCPGDVGRTRTPRNIRTRPLTISQGAFTGENIGQLRSDNVPQGERIRGAT